MKIKERILQFNLFNEPGQEVIPERSNRFSSETKFLQNEIYLSIFHFDYL